MPEHNHPDIPTWSDITPCDHGDEATTGLSRRNALALAGITPLAVGAFTPASAAAQALAPVGGVARAALHVHSSFSEGAGGLQGYVEQGNVHGSMESHLASLTRLGFDLAMFTDHDHRLAADEPGQHPKSFPTLEDFTHPNPEWRYSATPYKGATGSFKMNAEVGLEISTPYNGPGTYLVYCACATNSWTYRTSLAGMTLTVTLNNPTFGGVGEIWVLSSFRPALAGRPEGGYGMRYRIDPDATQRTVTAEGLQAVVTIPAQDGVADYTVNPTADLARAFPDLADRNEDTGLYGLYFGVTPAPGSHSTVRFKSIRFNRSYGLDEMIGIQADLMRTLQRRYPRIVAGQGLELSYSTHMNWLASGPVWGLPPRESDASLTGYLTRLVRTVANENGVSTFNHPFGATRGPLKSPADQAAAVTKVARTLLATRLYGADYLEVGYNIRGGVNLDSHLKLWDILLAAGIRVLANGTSDNHNGNYQSWVRDQNSFATDVIAGNASPGTVIPAMANGRAFVSSWNQYRGMLDMRLNGRRMGSAVQVSGSASLPLEVTATNLPSNGKVRMVQRRVHGDTSSTTLPSPVQQSTWGARAGTSDGSRTVAVDPVRSTVRTEVLDGRGRVVAFSNPMWIVPQ